MFAFSSAPEDDPNRLLLARARFRVASMPATFGASVIGRVAYADDVALPGRALAVATPEYAEYAERVGITEAMLGASEELSSGT